jgi:hypothetical protein
MPESSLLTSGPLTSISSDGKIKIIITIPSM